MADLVFVILAIAFFGLCVVYVRALDRMVGPDAEPKRPGEQLR